MALSDLFSWGKAARAAASSACGAGDKPDIRTFGTCWG